jgi:hypothetical protein
MLQAEWSWVQDPTRSLNFFIYLILPATVDPEVHSAANRNEYRTQKKIVLGKRTWPVCGADNLTAICEPTA